MLLHGVTNGQIQTTHYAQGISMCCCTVLQMARYKLHIMRKVYPYAAVRCWPDTNYTLCARYIHMRLQGVTNGQIQTTSAVARCYKWPDTDSTLCAKHIHVLLHGVTNGQIQTPHCAQGISMCCCTVLQMARYRLHIVRKAYPCAVARCYKWPDTNYTLCASISMCCCTVLQMARYRLYIVRKAYPCAVARCYKWPDTDSTLCARHIHVLLHGVTNGQIQTPHCAQGISMCCCTVLQMARYILLIVHKVYPCAVASGYKWPDIYFTFWSRYTLVLLQGVTNGQISTPLCAQGKSKRCCKLIQNPHCAQGI